VGASFYQDIRFAPLLYLSCNHVTRPVAFSNCSDCGARGAAKIVVRIQKDNASGRQLKLGRGSARDSRSFIIRDDFRRSPQSKRLEKAI